MTVDSATVLGHLRDQREEMVALLRRLVDLESPSGEPPRQVAVRTLVIERLEGLDYAVQLVPSPDHGDHVIARPADHDEDRPSQRLFELNDVERGVTVNVGTVDGGMRPNVVAPEASARIDARVFTAEDGRRVDAAIRALRPVDENVRLEVDGGFDRPPMERNPANERLWRQALSIGEELGVDLEAAVVGGASDGNLTSRYTPTLDGLGAVGGGAHRVDEHVVIEAMAERAALLALLLMAPLSTSEPGGPDDDE
jgi:acetylornithine deacetylase/succinyl-diaminopimelate desuccinylase-like protein